jgi:hypothetical protein
LVKGLAVLWMFLAAPAHALAPSEVGVGIGLVADLPDPASDSHTRFKPGPSLAVPVRWDLTKEGGDVLLRLRATGRAEFAFGRDQLTWDVGVAGASVRVSDDDHLAVLTHGGLIVGPEIVVPLQEVQPYFGVGFGMGWVGTFHSLSGDTTVLLDPDQNDLDNPNNLDPYTSQAVVQTELTIGLDMDAGQPLFVELGIGGAWVGERSLRKSPERVDAMRSAYGWNPLRLTAGVLF